MWLKSIGFLLAFNLLFAGLSFAAAVGDEFPGLRLPNVESGEEFDVGSYLHGKVGVVVFMQTTCSVCKLELTALKEIFERLKSFNVVAVSVDSGTPGKVVRFKENNQLPFLFVHDPEFLKPSVFGFRFTPGLVMTGRDGRIAFLKGGFSPADRLLLEKKIDELTQ